MRTTIVVINVSLLGLPRARRCDAPVHLRSRATWALFASLLLEPQTDRRGLLALRFWPGGDERKSLGMALTSLRQAFGSDCLTADRDRVILDRRGFTTDIDTIAACIAQAEAAPAGAGEAHWLMEAALAMGGVFLADYDIGRDEGGWVTHRQITLRKQHIRVLARLADLLEANGDRAGAAEWEERAATLFPDCEAAQARFWRRVSSPHTLQKEGSFGLPPPRVEARCHLALARLLLLPPPLQRTLARLALFPNAFTGLQAAAVGTSPEQLTSLREEGFLSQQGYLFAVFPPVARVLAASAPQATRLSREEREQLQEARSRWCIAAFATFAARSPGNTDDNRAAERLVLHVPDALEWLHRQPPTFELLRFGRNLRLMGFPHLAAREQSWSGAVAECSDYTPEMRAMAAHNAYLCAYYRADWRKARQYLLQTRQTASPEGIDTLMHYSDHLCSLALVCHHAEEADIAVSSAREAVTCLRSIGKAAASALTLALFTLAEVLSPLDTSAALAASVEALTLQRTLNHVNLRAALYQVGVLRLVSGEVNEAGAAFDEALPLFEEIRDTHGVADCLRGLGQVRARQGSKGEAFFLVRESLRRYEEIGANQSRAGGLQTLGDILCASGDRKGARAAYVESLDLWKAAGHRRWTALLEARLNGVPGAH